MSEEIRVTARGHAEEWLRIVRDMPGDDIRPGDEATVDALLGIGYALLDVADAIREHQPVPGVITVDLDSEVTEEMAAKLREQLAKAVRRGRGNGSTE